MNQNNKIYMLISKHKFPLLLSTFLLLVTPLIFTSCDDEDEEFTPSPQQTIFEIAEDDGRFSVLTEAVTRAGLENTLRGSGTFTVFAPTDAAFQDFLNTAGFANLDEVVAEVGEAGLRQILLYHVLGVEVASGDVAAGYVNTLAETEEGSGDNLDVRISTDNGVQLNGMATVTETDINALNGIIHVIDGVITPMNVSQFIKSDPSFSELAGATAIAESNGTVGAIDSLLNNNGLIFTVFAPTNEAFVDAEPVTSNLTAEELGNALLYHAILGNNITSDEVPSGSVQMASQDEIIISLDNGVVITDGAGNQANVIETDIQTINGVLHRIDRVILAQ